MFYLFSSAFVVGGLGFEFCVFVAGWRHALRSEWPFIIIIIIIRTDFRNLSAFVPEQHLAMGMLFANILIGPAYLVHFVTRISIICTFTCS